MWGEWNPLSPRDAEALRRIAAIERVFHENLVSRDWAPHVPTEQFGVFASRWPTSARTLWTIVNRNSYDVQGAQLRIPAISGLALFRLWHGTELQPYTAAAKRFCNSISTPTATVRSWPFSAPDPELSGFLMRMRSGRPALLRALPTDREVPAAVHEGGTEDPHESRSGRRDDLDTCRHIQVSGQRNRDRRR